MNATASFNRKSSHNDHIMPGTVSKNVSKMAYLENQWFRPCFGGASD
jgi:hypothetical protein